MSTEDGQPCPWCGKTRRRELYAFPPKMAERFGRDGEWIELPCSPECARLDELDEWEQARVINRIDMLWRMSGVSARMAEASFENFDPGDSTALTAAAERVAEWCDGWESHRKTGRGLFLAGPVGTGKTHLAVAAMRDVILRWKTPALFWTVPELLDAIRAAQDDDGARREAVKKAQGAELLILDDVGAERMTEWARERMFVILNHRYRESLPTIFTSNDMPKALAAEEKLGHRIVSRLLESCQWVKVEANDYRAKIARGEA